MLIQKGGCVYIIANQTHAVLYTGVTSDLQKRIPEHLQKKYLESFTAKYNCTKLLWFESFPQISEAIAKEKLIKGGSRASKIAMIESLNPGYKDLWLEDVSKW